MSNPNPQYDPENVRDEDVFDKETNEVEFITNNYGDNYPPNMSDMMAREIGIID